jgi:hypothetical protein
MRAIVSPLVFGIAMIAAAVLSDSRQAAAADPIPSKLAPETYEVIKTRLTLTREDLAWQRIRWRNGFFQGIVEAQAADKPIFYWLYYGDPRGYC